MKVDSLLPQFVEYAPRELEPGTLYISIPYDTIVHLCCCGCGNKVALQLSPAGWAVTYNGETISVSPSVGNSSLPCRSHYWVRNGHVEWLPSMTDTQTARARARDRAAQDAVEQHRPLPSEPNRRPTLIERIRAIWQRVARRRK